LREKDRKTQNILVCGTRVESNGAIHCFRRGAIILGLQRLPVSSGVHEKWRRGKLWYIMFSNANLNKNWHSK
jgi:hypothetical protein